MATSSTFQKLSKWSTPNSNAIQSTRLNHLLRSHTDRRHPVNDAQSADLEPLQRAQVSLKQCIEGPQITAAQMQCSNSAGYSLTAINLEPWHPDVIHSSDWGYTDISTFKQSIRIS